MKCIKCGGEMDFDLEDYNEKTGKYSADFQCVDCGHIETVEEERENVS